METPPISLEEDRTTNAEAAAAAAATETTEVSFKRVFDAVEAAAKAKGRSLFAQAADDLLNANQVRAFITGYLEKNSVSIDKAKMELANGVAYRQSTMMGPDKAMMWDTVLKEFGV